MDSNDSPPARSDELPTVLKPLARQAALVGLLALVLNLSGNGRVGLWDRDEPRYAGCTREMRASGDWVHPTFNAEPRYHKPVLIYWLMLAGTAIGGDNPFGARLISSLAGAATCVLVWAWGRRMLGPRAGLMAGLVLATAPIMVAESKMATTDATLTLWVVACQFALWELAHRPSRLMAAVFWGGLGLAILTKSPAGPVLIAASGIVSWWWGGPTACWARLRWRWGPLLCAAIAVPWNVAILLRSDGEYYNVAVGYHIIRRMTRGIEDHGGFPGYYVVISMLTFFPWSALVPAALYGAWKRRRESPVFGFLLGWVVGPLILLECVRTKLIHYYLPAFPACALLVGWLAVAIADSRRPIREWPLGRSAIRLLLGIGGGAGLALGAAACWLPAEMRWPCLALVVLMIAGGILCVRPLLAGATETAFRRLIVTFALVLLTTGTWLLPSAEPYRISARVGRRLAALEARERTRVVLGSYQLPSVVYTLGHPAPMFENRDELVDSLERDGKVLTALLPPEYAKLRLDSRMVLTVHETIRGFNLDKGQNEVLHLTTIRPSVATYASRHSWPVLR
jgi:4-amino-4-deoxy-L-arabinose transferase-like glycosyltransferase